MLVIDGIHGGVVVPRRLGTLSRHCGRVGLGGYRTFVSKNKQQQQQQRYKANRTGGGP
jgi:hypothetical protein